MKRPTTIRLLTATVTVIVAVSGTLLRSHSIAAAEPLAANSPAASPRGDGTLFTAFVPVLRHPRCMNCHSQGDSPGRAMTAIRMPWTCAAAPRVTE
jgi:hypothetical protein